MTHDWIDGGFFVFSQGLFDYLDVGDEVMLEDEPLENLAKDGQLMMYKHEGFWKCVDTYRDLLELENQLKTKKARWHFWEK